MGQPVAPSQAFRVGNEERPWLEQSGAGLRTGERVRGEMSGSAGLNEGSVAEPSGSDVLESTVYYGRLAAWLVASFHPRRE